MFNRFAPIFALIVGIVAASPAYALRPDVDRALNEVENTADLYLTVMDDYLKRIEPRLPQSANATLRDVREDRNDYMDSLRSALRRTGRLQRPNLDNGVVQIERVTNHYMKRMRSHVGQLLRQKADVHYDEGGKQPEQAMLGAFEPLRTAFEQARTQPEQARGRLDTIGTEIERYVERVNTILKNVGSIDKQTANRIWALRDKALSRLDDDHDSLSEYRRIVEDVREMAERYHDRFLGRVTIEAYSGTKEIDEEPWAKLQLLTEVPRRIETGVRHWARSILPIDPLERSEQRATLARSRAQSIFTTLLQDRRHGRLVRADAEVYSRAYSEAFERASNSYEYYQGSDVADFLNKELRAITMHRDHMRTISDFELPDSARPFMDSIKELGNRFEVEIRDSQYNVRH